MCLPPKTGFILEGGSMVSVIIPTYNRKSTILRAINSVLNQSYQDLEIIVVDDASTDDSFEIITGLANERVRCIKLDNHSGACVARNRGVEEAKGEFIAFQDSDDEWFSDKLEKQFEKMMSNNADICVCKLITVGKRKSVVFPDLNREGYITNKDIYSRTLISTQCILAKREVFDDVRFDPQIYRWQDYDWSIRAISKYSVYFVNEILVRAYPSSNSLTSSGPRQVVEVNRLFLAKYRELCNENKDLEASIHRNIGYFKTICKDRDAHESYIKEFMLSPGWKALARLCLSRLNLLYWVYSIIGKLPIDEYVRDRDV